MSRVVTPPLTYFNSVCLFAGRIYILERHRIRNSKNRRDVHMITAIMIMSLPDNDFFSFVFDYFGV